MVNGDLLQRLMIFSTTKESTVGYNGVHLYVVNLDRADFIPWIAVRHVVRATLKVVFCWVFQSRKRNVQQQIHPAFFLSSNQPYRRWDLSQAEA